MSCERNCRTRETTNHIRDIRPAHWDALNKIAGGSFLTSHAMLNGFEMSNSVSPSTGWQAQHLQIKLGEELIAVMPLYAKSHSYGEFIFDWTWAQAYEQHGIDYYPKWLCGVPLTPVQGPRLLCRPEHKTIVAGALKQLVQKSGLSSMHVLFTEDDDQQALQDAGFVRRTHLQFHWRNQGWASFEAFTQSLSRSKRKNIRQERQKVAAANIQTGIKIGTQISAADWAFFYQCYVNTYSVRGRTPYLSKAFFDWVGDALPQHCVMSIAYRDQQPIASALCWYETRHEEKRLYGRYWGSLQEIDCLHFEVAYYSFLEWAIEHQVQYFEGGAQGPHKMARGFMPVITQSAHWMANSGFQQAIEQACQLESKEIMAYFDHLGTPFKTSLGKPESPDPLQS